VRASSNDSGDFKITRVPPGTYIVKTRTLPSGLNARAPIPAAKPGHLYNPNETYYGDTRIAGDAAPVKVDAGQNVALGVIRMRNRALPTVRGKVTGDLSLLADAHVSALAADAAGRLWVGYFDRGLDVIDSGFAHATHIENDAVFCVNRIALDRQGRRTAVATANGLVLFDAAARPRQTLTRRDGLIANHVTDVELRDDGMLIATPAGLTIVDSTGTRSLNAFHGLVNNHVYAIASEGPTILAGTLGGLSIFENGVVKASYTTSNSRLKHHWITALARVGDEWFAGTYGAGIERLDSTGQWRSFPDANDAGVINPNAMLVTENRVYAGTLDHGLYAYDRRGGRWTPVSNGLPSRNVTALAARDGYIHIGTDNGLVRIPERNLENR